MYLIKFIDFNLKLFVKFYCFSELQQMLFNAIKGTCTSGCLCMCLSVCICTPVPACLRIMLLCYLLKVDSL